MRRNLTISFDETFIALMDDKRGGLSRGVWIEAAFKKLLLEVGTQKPPTPKAERSPSVEQLADEIDDNVMHRALLGKPPLQRPLVQKRGK